MLIYIGAQFCLQITEHRRPSFTFSSPGIAELQLRLMDSELAQVAPNMTDGSTSHMPIAPNVSGRSRFAFNNSPAIVVPHHSQPQHEICHHDVPHVERYVAPRDSVWQNLIILWGNCCYAFSF